MKYKKLTIVILILMFIISLILYSQSRSDYVIVETLTERLNDDFVLLHEIIQPNERLGRYIGNVESNLYEKNEGWILRNKSYYCSNRIIDNVEVISEQTNIKNFKGDLPDDYHRDIEVFKSHLVDMNDICVTENILDSGDKVLEAGLFIDSNHNVWKKR